MIKKGNIMKNITIFDLDGTCIDSTHRQATRPDGTLNLEHWIENATPEKIFGDSLLPLAQQINKRTKQGDFVIVCTARQMSDADFEFLMNEGINPHKIISPNAQRNSFGISFACTKMSLYFFFSFLDPKMIQK